MDCMGSLWEEDLADGAVAAGEDEQAMLRVVHAMPIVQLRERQRAVQRRQLECRA